MHAPAVVGLLRPVLLVPVGALAGLPAEQVELLLIHELAHIRRYDYLVNALQSMVEALLFYHPAVWWVSGQMRSEREMCCDDAAVAITGDAPGLARALAQIGAAEHAHQQAAMAATGGSLVNRVARLLGVPRPASRTHSLAAVAAAALIAISAIAVLGQTARPKFEAAPSSPRAAAEGEGCSPSPGRLTASAPLRVLMEAAYHVQPFQIVGGPEWVEIGWLRRRCQGVRQSEPRADDAHAAIAAGGPVPVADPSRVARSAGLRAGARPWRAQTTASAGWKLCAGGGAASGPRGIPPPAPRCGGVDVLPEAGGWHMRGGKVPMAEFVRTLSRLLGRAVTDQSAFSGVFDVNLDFRADDTIAGMPLPPPGAIPAETASPSIFSAVQQLGLRLESTKGPLEVLVIDHVERPSAN